MADLDNSPSTHAERTILSGPADLLQSSAYTFLQSPIDGVTQIVSKVTGTHLQPLQIISAPSEHNGWTFAGDTLGSVAQFVLASKGLRLGLAKAGVMSAAAPMTILETTATGAAVDVLHPVSDSENNFLWAKVRNAGIAAGTFAVMSGTSNLVGQIDFVGRAGRRGIAESIGVNAFSGMMGGMANAELEAVGHGKLAPDADTLTSRTAQYAAFGALFGVADATLNRAKIVITPAKNSAHENVPTTEEYVAHLNRPLKSPLLTWIAENRPNLRPPNYEAYKASIGTTPTAELQHLDLNDWSVQQRPLVLSEIRKIASRTQLSSDSNIDAFISRLNIPELHDYASPSRVALRTQAYTGWAEASGRLDAYITADPVLREMHLGNLLKDTKLQETNPQLKGLIADVGTTEGAYRDLVAAHVAETNVNSALTKTLNGIAKEVGLPKLNGVEITNDHRQGSYASQDLKIGIGENVVKDGLTAETAETGLHEFVHHDTRAGFVGTLLTEAPSNANPIAVQLRIGRELSNLSQPGGTLNLLQRLGDRTTMTYRTLTANGALPKDINFYAEYARDGKVETATWDEAGINKELQALLEARRVAARQQAWSMHTNYVGTAVELPAWSTGFLTKIRSRALGLPDPEVAPSTLPPTISVLEK